jgi:hydroxymethylbilane synthase
VAGHAIVAAGRLIVRGLVGRPDASEMIRETVEGDPREAAALGTALGRRLLERGADEILRSLET